VEPEQKNTGVGRDVLSRKIEYQATLKKEGGKKGSERVSKPRKKQRISWPKKKKKRRTPALGSGERTTSGEKKARPAKGGRKRGSPLGKEGSYGREKLGPPKMMQGECKRKVGKLSGRLSTLGQRRRIKHPTDWLG